MGYRGSFSHDFYIYRYTYAKVFFLATYTADSMILMSYLNYGVIIESSLLQRSYPYRIEPFILGLLKPIKTSIEVVLARFSNPFLSSFAYGALGLLSSGLVFNCRTTEFVDVS